MKVAKTKIQQQGNEYIEVLDNKVDGESILNETISTDKIENNAVTTDKIKNTNVTKDKLSQELQDEIDSHPGKKTAEGGEIFNNYANNALGDYSHAEGDGTIAGWPVYYISSVSDDGLTCKINTLDGLTINTMICFYTYNMYAIDIYSIINIDSKNKEITVDHKIPLDSNRFLIAPEYGHPGQITDNETFTSAHAEGCSTSARGRAAHAEGLSTDASGDCSHTEGTSTTASGDSSHAEGSSSSTISSCSHAEGVGTGCGITCAAIIIKNIEKLSDNLYKLIFMTKINDEVIQFINDYPIYVIDDTSNNINIIVNVKTVTNNDITITTLEDISNDSIIAIACDRSIASLPSIIIGVASHAEGHESLAFGTNSHTEGFRNNAYGFSTHTEGMFNEAYSEFQHVQGRCNIPDMKARYAHIVGNGKTRDSRSNAHTLDWQGNAWYSGDIKMGGTDYDTDAISVLGDKSITNENDIGKTTATVGGIKEGTDITKTPISQLLRDMLLPYKKTGLSLTMKYKINNSTYSTNKDIIYLPTDSITFTEYSYRITRYTNKPTSMSVYINNKIIKTIDPGNTNSGSALIDNGGETISLANTITTSIPIKISCNDGEDSSGKPLISTHEFNIIIRPSVYYGNSNKTFTVDSSKNIVLDSGTDILNVLSNSNPNNYDSYRLYDYDTSNVSFEYSFKDVNNEYSYVLLPGTKTINNALDKNGFTQKITYIGKTNITFGSTVVPYKLFITGTATATAPTYTFYVV